MTASQPQILDCFFGYEPIIDNKRNVSALRVRLEPRGNKRPSMSQLYAEFALGWPRHSKPILLSAPDATLDDSILECELNPDIWVEVPARSTVTAADHALLGAMHAKGFGMAIGGRTPAPLPGALVPAFRMSVIHVSDDRRLKNEADNAEGFKRSIPYAQDGVTSIELMEKCFAKGAQSVLGWPMQDVMSHRTRDSSAPDYLAIMQLIGMADRGEDPPKMEAVIRRDPAIAYRLLRYINSAGFGLSVEVQSFRHAIMMLGYKKLKRWLALLLATSSKDANMRPVMLASFRRGLFLEHLLGVDDETTRDEVFILGVFSLLDKLMKKPFEELLGNLAVPERVYETLVEKRGQFVPYLGIVEAIEQGPDRKLGDRLDECLMTLAACNEAVMRALSAPELHQA
ncbi:MAG: EAL and HDOD domain-containing protein [Lautropia sp.]